MTGRLKVVGIDMAFSPGSPPHDREVKWSNPQTINLLPFNQKNKLYCYVCSGPVGVKLERAFTLYYYTLCRPCGNFLLYILFAACLSLSMVSLLAVYLPPLCLWHCCLFISPYPWTLLLVFTSVYSVYLSLCLWHSCLFTSPSPPFVQGHNSLSTPHLSLCVLPLQLSLYSHCRGNTREYREIYIIIVVPTQTEEVVERHAVVATHRQGSCYLTAPPSLPLSLPPQVHFLHADSCLIPRSLLLAIAAHPLPSPDYVLVDDYWMSFVLSHHLQVPLWKIKGISHCTTTSHHIFHAVRIMSACQHNEN